MPRLLIAIMALTVAGFGFGCVDDHDRSADIFNPKEYGEWEYDGQPDIDGPERVMMGDMLPGETRTRQIEVLNVGRAPLKVGEWNIEGPFDFSFPLYDGTPPERLMPGEGITTTISHTASDELRVEGKLLVASNDPDEPIFEIDLFANADFPCLELEPAEVDFGQRDLGTTHTQGVFATNCSARSEVLFEIEDVEGDPEFGVTQTTPGGSPEFSLEPGETVEIPVTFRPESPGEYAAEIFIDSNDEFEPERTVELFGRGRPYDCPSAVIEASNANRNGRVVADPSGQLNVVPLDTINLDASGSVDPENSGIDRYEWSIVDRPSDSTNDFENVDGSSATIWMQTAGTYVVELQVWNGLGVQSCEPARLQLDVIPDEDIHLQLVWNTPSDNDQTDNNGTDVDLHFLHPNAGGNWNYAPWDCFWRNMEPDWGVEGDPTDDPSLDIDDVNGAGPENINLDNPEVGLTYDVGVYYYADHNFGRSLVTTRIYLGGQLVMELSGKEMRNQEFWHVAKIDWPSGAIERIDRMYDSFPR
ncbi:MAG: choice-of-anchor D domain-containing protein [Myxococcota bacterium]